MASSNICDLDHDEIKRATAIGKARQAEAKRMGLADKHGFFGDGEEIHVLGALGECACAKLLGLRWGGEINTFKRKPDLIDRQVRTRTKPWHELIVRKDDSDVDRFLLMIRHGQRTFEYKGWIFGKDAKRTEWLQTHGAREAAYFVPQTSLHRNEIREDNAALLFEAICPCCGAIGFRRVPLKTTELKTTELLICSQGCTGRAIAGALSLESWP